MNEELFKRFLNDQCSQDDIDEIIKWANEPTQKDQLFALLEKKWNEPDLKKEPDFVYEDLLRKITDQISGDEIIQNRKTKSGNPVFKKYTDYIFYAKIAASIAIFILVSAVSLTSYLRDQKKDQSQDIAYVVKSTAIGEKLTVRLPDGTLVNLNSASSIRYPDLFPAGQRDVFLTGEAFFEVKRDTKSSFIVHSGNVRTTALGTSFNICAENNEVKVALTSGKVKVALINTQSPKELIMHLVPGEMAIYQKGRENIQKEKFDLEEVIGWKNGKIHFEHASLSDIIFKLENWYGVAITVDPRLLNAPKFTGSINNENLENILQGLCFSLECDYRLNGRKVEIKMK